MTLCVLCRQSLLSSACSFICKKRTYRAINTIPDWMIPLAARLQGRQPWGGVASVTSAPERRQARKPSPGSPAVGRRRVRDGSGDGAERRCGRFRQDIRQAGIRGRDTVPEAAATASDMAFPAMAMSRATSGGRSTQLTDVCWMTARNSLFQSNTVLSARAVRMPAEPRRMVAAISSRAMPGWLVHGAGGSGRSETWRFSWWLRKRLIRNISLSNLLFSRRCWCSTGLQACGHHLEFDGIISFRMTGIL